MSEANCIFCKIVKKEIKAEIIYENEKVLAFLDKLPRSPGHTLVIPKKHVPDLLELPDKDLQTFFGGVKVVMRTIERALKPDGFTLGMNHGKPAGQVVLHLHFHIIPRWSGDGGMPLQGVVSNPPEQSIEKMAEKIRGKSRSKIESHNYKKNNMTKLTIIHIQDCTCCESVIKIAKELEKEMDIELKLQDWGQSLDLIEENKIVSSPAVFINDKFVHAGELTKDELKSLIQKYEQG